MIGDRAYYLFEGDNRHLMANMGDNTVDAVVTDPPYHLTSIAKRFGGDNSAPQQWGTNGAYARAARGFMNAKWDGVTAPPIDPGFGHWLAGFADGEGCFTTRRNGAGFVCEFVIHIRADDAAILHEAQKRTGIGTLREAQRGDGANPMIKWVVSKQLDCMRLVAIFTAFPLRAKKKRDFELWAEAVNLWVTHEAGASWRDLADYAEALSAIKKYGADFDPSQLFHYLWAKEALRVLKPGGYLVAFGGTRTYHRLATAIEDAGFEIRDMLEWLYGSGFPKGSVVDGWGPALKPGHEPICMARKPFRGSIAGCRAEWGTGALNIDGCRVPGADNTARPNGEIGYHSNGLGRGTIGGGDAAGRFPANVVHDGSWEVLEGFPAQAGAASRVLGDEPSSVTNGIFGKFDARLPGTFYADQGSAARFFYCAKASNRDRDEGCEALPTEAAGLVSENSGQHLTRRDEGYEVAQRANVHPTVKPTDLMRWLVRLVTPAGGIVFDPFTGSGSTGKAAMLEGFRFLGAEMTVEYLPIARARIYHAWHVRAYGCPPPAVAT